MSTALITLTKKAAQKYDMGDAGEELVAVLKATAFKGPASDAQLTALMIVANQYGLNPFTKEIFAFPDKNNGIVPVVGVDGWARIINEHPQFDGMDFEQTEEDCTCVMYRKDRSHPVRVTEYLSECKRGTGPWSSHPKRMLRHKAMIQCARLAFGYVGIYDQDEAERITEVEVNPSFRQAASEQPPPLPPYPAADFAKNLTSWRKAIAAGKATADQIIGRSETKYTLSEQQKIDIRTPESKPEQPPIDTDDFVREMEQAEQ